MDDEIAQKIRELTLLGVRKRGEMRRHLNNFVRNEMYKGRTPPPSYRRRFFPRRKDLDYHMAKAKLANRLANLDQENVEALIAKWKKNSPDDLFFFRKREAVTEETSGRESPEEIYQNTGEDGEEDEEEEPEPSPMEGEHPLLFCYQTQQQRKLLLKYGNDMCLMDATYKTTRYALPLFSFASEPTCHIRLLAHLSFNIPQLRPLARRSRYSISGIHPGSLDTL